MNTEANAHENTIYGSFGEFEPIAEADDTPEFWDEHNAEFDAMMREEDEANAMADFWDYEPSPYDGTYSEM